MTENSMRELMRLRRIAEAATPGPWTDVSDDGEEYSRPPATGAFLVEYGADADQKMRDILYIASFDPPTVLALLDRLERAEKTIEEVRSNLDDYVTIDSEDAAEWECEPEDRWRMVRDLRGPILRYEQTTTREIRSHSDV